MAFVLLEKGKARSAFEKLYKEYPDAKYYLNFENPVQLLVAAILSAQTKDEVVNATTPRLFDRFRTAKDYASASIDELVKYTGRVSFAGNKSRNIIETCNALVEKYDGKVPKTIDELVALPGVGRKTANTILTNAYGIVKGIPVDTWVIKLTHRIGITDGRDSEGIEEDLMTLLDKKYWHNAAYVFKAHGRRICQSKVPICSRCVLKDMCPKNDVKKSA